MCSTCTSQWNLVRIVLWSTLAATIYSTCSKPGDLTYAVANAEKDSYEEGDQVTYSCLSDYKYIPTRNNKTTCENGNWTTFSDVFCSKLDCGIPDILKNGKVTFSDTVVGSIATHKCLEGYMLFGSDTRYCLANEKWNGTVPSCNRTCSEPPKLQFAIINSTTSQTDHYYPESFKIDYVCITGFFANISLNSFTICQRDFTWSKITEFCMRVSCGSPGAVENGNVQIEDDKFESRAVFVCNDGYKLVGDSYRECLEDGSWSGTVPTCERSCPDPPVPDYVQIIELPENQYFPAGIIVTYRCLTGYKYDLFLSPTILCMESFTWSNMTTFCKKVICGEPERIKNGNLQITGTDFGSIAVYSCNKGYNLIGNPHRKCKEDGLWEGSPPVCQCTLQCLLNTLHYGIA